MVRGRCSVSGKLTDPLDCDLPILPPSQPCRIQQEKSAPYYLSINGVAERAAHKLKEKAVEETETRHR